MDLMESDFLFQPHNRKNHTLDSLRVVQLCKKRLYDDRENITRKLNEEVNRCGSHILICEAD